MTIPLPRGRIIGLLTRKSTYDLPIQFSGAAGLGFLALREYQLGNRVGFGMALTGFVLLTVFVLVRWALARSEERLRTSHDPLVGVLTTLRYMLLAIGRQADTAGLRLCIYVPVRDKKRRNAQPTQLCRVTPYVGDCPSNLSGAYVDSAKGIVGRCLRTQSAAIQIVKLPPTANLADFLVASFGYNRFEAAQMRQDTRVWAAVAVTHSRTQEVIGIIYADAGQQDFFGKAGSTRQSILEGAAVALAEFAEQYYE